MWENQRTDFVRWFSGIPRCSPPSAMYASTPVRTYIAKSPKRAIYAILYSTEVVWVILTQTTRFRSSSHFENLISVVSSSSVKKISTLSPINISWSFWPTEKQVILSQEQISKLKWSDSKWIRLLRCIKVRTLNLPYCARWIKLSFW